MAAGFKGIARVRSRDPRARRNAQQLAMAAENLLSGILTLNADGEITIALASSGGLADVGNELTIDLRDTTPGLELHSTGLGVIVGSGLELTATGVEVDLATDPGLEFSSEDLRVKVKTNGGIVRDSDGLSVDPDEVISGSDGIDVTNGVISVDLSASSGLAFDTGLLEIDLATDPGLELTSGDLRVKVKASGGVVRDADGLSVEPDDVISGGDGVDVTNGVVSTDLASNSGLEFNAGLLQIDLDADFLSLGATGLQSPHFTNTSGVYELFASDASGASGESFTIREDRSTNLSENGRITFQDAAPPRCTLKGANVADNDAGTVDLLGGNASGTAGRGGRVRIFGGDTTASGTEVGGHVILRSGRPAGTGNSQTLFQYKNSSNGVGNWLSGTWIGASSKFQIGFFGSAGIARPGTYTITAAPSVSRALDADANGGAYSGIDNSQAGTVYAQVSDLNDLRSDVASLAAVLRQLIRDLGDGNGFGLLDETSY